MNTLEKALKFTLQWEGGYVNHPDDPGGATNKGITQNTYNAYRKSKKLAMQEVKRITDAEVEDIYLNNYWLSAGCHKLSEKAAIVMFDTAVNMGVGRAKEFLAKARLSMDSDPKNDDMELARRMIDLRVGYYYKIVENRPKSKVFLNGWLNRMRSLKAYVGY